MRNRFFLTIKSLHTPLKPVFSQSLHTLHCFSRILNHEGSLTVVQPLFEQKSILFTIDPSAVVLVPICIVHYTLAMHFAIHPFAAVLQDTIQRVFAIKNVSSNIYKL